MYMWMWNMEENAIAEVQGVEGAEGVDVAP